MSEARHDSWCKYHTWSGFGKPKCDCHLLEITALQERIGELEKECVRLREVAALECREHTQENAELTRKLRETEARLQYQESERVSSSYG